MGEIQIYDTAKEETEHISRQLIYYNHTKIIFWAGTSVFTDQQMYKKTAMKLSVGFIGGILVYPACRNFMGQGWIQK